MSAITGVLKGTASAIEKLATGSSASNKSDVGYNNSTNKADRGYANVAASTAKPAPSGDPGGSGGGGGGGGRKSGGGGGGGGSGTNPKEIKASVKNLGDIYGRKKDQLEKDTKAKLDSINQKREANDASLTQQNTQIMKNIEWQPQQQKEQSTLTSLRDRMGNSAYGSSMVDLQEGMHRIDDMADVQLINTYKQNTDNAYNNWFQADSDLVSDYNEAIADANSKMADLLNQYQAALNNVSPTAASTKNINKASKKAAALSKAKKDLKTKKTALKAAKKAAKKSSNKKTKSALAAAQKAVKKAQKSVKKNTVTVGKGKNKITLPGINMNPTSAFSKMTGTTMQNSSAINPRTRDFIRPSRANDTTLGSARGDYNTADDANRAFADNLRAYRRV